MRTIGQAFLVIALLVGFAGGVASDQTDARLNGLFQKLKRAETFSIAHRTEQQIWAIWHERPGEPDVAELMERGLRAMRASDLVDALDAFDRAVGLAPDFAEAWNKRATVHFLLGNYPASIDDVRQTLLLEPRHFGALSGLGHINLALGRKAEALEAFEAALDVHPYLQERFGIKALRDEVAGEKI